MRSDLLPPDVRKHESGLRIQAVTGPAVRMLETHTIELPPCCPISGNPQPGSTLTLSYRPAGWCIEVYSLRQLVDRFRGGWKGTDRYPAERNMEGMIALVAQMAADALNVRVRGRAALVLDVGPLELRVKADPCSST
jgi:NADPH-dependent 7-cyano-7-deazaguanine reductase QueF